MTSCSCFVLHRAWVDPPSTSTGNQWQPRKGRVVGTAAVVSAPLFGSSRVYVSVDIDVPTRQLVFKARGWVSRLDNCGDTGVATKEGNQISRSIGRPIECA